jgi:hypothetical protein
MALSTSILAADLAVIVADLPTAVTWEGQTFNAVVADIANTDVLDIAGITEGAQATVDYLLSAITGGPIAVNDSVTIAGVSYRVLSAFIHPDGISARVEIRGEDQ